MTAVLTLSLLWRPYFDTAPTLTCLAVLLGLAVWARVRSADQNRAIDYVTFVMRCALIALIGLLLMGPSAIRPGIQSPDKPTLRVLVDTSASMQTKDAGGLSRFDFIGERWLTPARLLELRESYRVEYFGFDESLRAINSNLLYQSASESAAAGVSNIARSVTDAVVTPGSSGESGVVAITGSAMLVFSDGRDTLDAPMQPVGRLALSRSTPIYTVPLGGPSLSRDVAVIAVPQQPYLFAEEPGSIAVRVMRSNTAPGGTLLHVAHGGETHTFPIVFNNEDTAAVDVPITLPEPGTYEYRVWVDPVPGEVDETNNEQPVFVEVTAKRLRVLLLEGQPYWDTKFLAHSLRKDARIELTQVTQVTRDKRETLVSQEGTTAVIPETLENLGRFDVIILGRNITDVMDARVVSLLPKYVSDHGGRLVFARGRAHDERQHAERAVREAMDVLEPVVFGEGELRQQKLELDAAGIIHPSLSQASSPFGAAHAGDALPTLLSVPVVKREKATARVLARCYPAGAAVGTGTGQPAIVTMPYGRGMVVAVLGEGLWQWGLRPRNNSRSDAAFDRFWLDTVRWLALGSDYQPGKAISLQLSRMSVQAGDPIHVDLVSRDGFNESEVLLYIESPDGTRTTLAPAPVGGSTTRRRVVLHPDQPGIYRVTANTTQAPDEAIVTRFNCYNIDIERLHNSANRAALRVLAESSGGRCLSPEEPDELAKILSRQREAAASPPRPYYLWDRGWMLTLVLGWAGLEWIIRRAGGLL